MPADMKHAVLANASNTSDLISVAVQHVSAGCPRPNLSGGQNAGCVESMRDLDPAVCCRELQINASTA